MIKKLLITVLLFSSILCYADDDYTKYGAIYPADFMPSKYDLDTTSDAIKLLDIGYFNINSNLEPSLVTHERIRILKKSGFEKSNIKIRFVSYNGRERIAHLKAHTYWIDSTNKISSKEVDNSQFHYTKINEYISEVSFTFPNLQVGCIIEYSYVKFTPFSRNLPSWYFQSNMPTLFSKYTIEVPARMQYTSISQGIDVQEKLKRNETTAYTADDPQFPNSVRIYTMQNLPAYEHEIYSNAYTDNIDKVDFFLRRYDFKTGGFPLIFNKSWEEESEILLKDANFGGMLKTFKKINDWVDIVPKEKLRDLNLAIKLRNEVANKLKWNESYSIYSFKSVNEVIERKEGNSAEINFVLMNLLKNLGYDVKPAIVSTKAHGTPLLDLPSPEQFNHTICVLKLNKVNYALDATTTNPWYMLPVGFNDRDIVIIDKDSSKILKIGNEFGFNVTQKNVITISESGKMNCKSTSNYEGYAREKELKEFSSTTNEKYFKSKINNLEFEFDSIKYQNEKIDTLPFETTFFYTLSDERTNVSKLYLNPIILTEFVNPFVTDKRVTDIDLQHLQNYEIKSTINFSNKYKLSDYPKEIQFTSDDGTMTFTRNVITSETQLRFKINISISEKVYSAQKYSEVKKFFSNVSKNLHDEIILIKNEK
jgi:hypothetical protein